MTTLGSETKFLSRMYIQNPDIIPCLCNCWKREGDVNSKVCDAIVLELWKTNDWFKTLCQTITHATDNEAAIKNI